jgi:hypothetical protein
MVFGLGQVILRLYLVVLSDAVGVSLKAAMDSVRAKARTDSMRIERSEMRFIEILLTNQR